MVDYGAEAVDDGWTGTWVGDVVDDAEGAADACDLAVECSA